MLNTIRLNVLRLFGARPMTMTGLHLWQCAQDAVVRLLSEMSLLVWNERLAPVVWVCRAWRPVWILLARAPLSIFPKNAQVIPMIGPSWVMSQAYDGKLS